MEKQKLINLLEKDVNFKEISKLYTFLENFLGNELVLPMIFGPGDHSLDDRNYFKEIWEVKLLEPNNQRTILTIKNYFECLKEIELDNKYYQERNIQTSPCNGEIIYSRYDGYQHESGLDVLVANATQNNVTFRLNLVFKDYKTGYYAYSELVRKIPSIEKISKRFVGPNFDRNNLGK